MYKSPALLLFDYKHLFFLDPKWIPSPYAVSRDVCWGTALTLLTSSAMRQCGDSPRHNTAWNIHRAQAVVSAQQHATEVQHYNYVYVYICSITA
jgi:hypothetical protein